MPGAEVRLAGLELVVLEADRDGLPLLLLLVAMVMMVMVMVLVARQ